MVIVGSGTVLKSMTPNIEVKTSEVLVLIILRNSAGDHILNYFWLKKYIMIVNILFHYLPYILVRMLAQV